MRRYLVLVPGLLGWLLVTFVAVMATVWSSIEMFHEGWWGSVPHRFVYLVPGFVITLLAAIPVRWPRPGGFFLGTVGLALVLFWRQFFSNQVGLEIAVPFVVAALLFIMEGWRLEKIKRGEYTPFILFRCPRNHFLCRRPRLTVTLGVPLLTFVGVVLTWGVLIAQRVDDGDRGARRITADEVDLVWAPEGPGWARGYLQGTEKQADLDSGGRGFKNPSWNQIALYGAADSTFHNASPEEMKEFCLCHYLNENGLSLADSAQNIWRLPTAQELAASLPHHGNPAGCVWDGTAGPMNCDRRPDKETPLWDPTRSPVYLLSATEVDSATVWFVSFNGQVRSTPKSWGNPRHGFRCVREPYWK